MCQEDMVERLFYSHLTTARISLISLGALVGCDDLKHHIFAQGGEGGLSEKQGDERGEAEHDLGV